MLGISLNGDQRKHFIRYCDAIQRVNQEMNLTALRTPQQIMRLLFLDSLTIAWAVRGRLHDAGSLLLIDIGSGAGIPGLPLKIVHPMWRLVMVESVRKKAHFLASVAMDLDLPGTRVLNTRAEEAGRDRLWRDSAGLCTARAVASLPVLLEWCAPLVAPGGLLCFPKSGAVGEEMRAADEAARALNARLEALVPVPADIGLPASRVVVVYRKTANTPATYPRRAGLAKSRPIGA